MRSSGVEASRRASDQFAQILSKSRRIYVYALPEIAEQVRTAEDQMLAAIDAALRARERRLLSASPEAAARKVIDASREAQSMLLDAYNNTPLKLVDELSRLRDALQRIYQQVEALEAEYRSRISSVDKEGVKAVKAGDTRRAEILAARKKQLLVSLKKLEARRNTLLSTVETLNMIIDQLVDLLPLYIKTASVLKTSIREKDVDKLRLYAEFLSYGEDVREKLKLIKDLTDKITGGLELDSSIPGTETIIEEWANAVSVKEDVDKTIDEFNSMLDAISRELEGEEDGKK